VFGTRYMGTGSGFPTRPTRPYDCDAPHRARGVFWSGSPLTIFGRSWDDHRAIRTLRRSSIIAPFIFLRPPPAALVSAPCRMELDLIVGRLQAKYDPADE
jgi:hypothetical protein